jgi:ABC-type lipoprotein release transport system permease subunit
VTAAPMPIKQRSRKLATEPLFGLQVEDPLSVGMTVATLLVTALVSTVVPAARATRIDPASALRHE